MGYKELDPVIGEDSFLAFEEVLHKACEINCDFLLLGGDLYHEMKPSQNTVSKVCQMINDSILGEKEITFDTYNYEPNYLNENMNIKLPIFIIHGT